MYWVQAFYFLDIFDLFLLIESQKWKSSLSLEKVQQMECYKKHLAEVKVVLLFSYM